MTPVPGYERLYIFPPRATASAELVVYCLCEMCGLTEAQASRVVMGEPRALCRSCAAHVDQSQPGE